MRTSHVIIIIITLAIWAYNVKVWFTYSKLLDTQNQKDEKEMDYLQSWIAEESNQMEKYY